MTNQWQHAAVSYDGATMRLYLDGVLVASDARALDASDGAFRLSGETTPSWQPATVDNGRWSFDLFPDLENFYQIRLRSADNYGNQGRVNTVWRGLIDAVPLRLLCSCCSRSSLGRQRP